MNKGQAVLALREARRNWVKRMLALHDIKRIKLTDDELSRFKKEVANGKARSAL